MNSIPDAFAASAAATIIASMFSSPEVASTASRNPPTLFLRRRFVGAHHFLHQRVPHHVAVAELDEPDAFHVAQDLARLVHPRRLAGGQIDLGGVAGDHGLRSKA